MHRYDTNGIQSKLGCLEVKVEELKSLDREILNFLLDSETGEKELDEEIKLADEYVKKYNTVSLTVQSRLIMLSLPESYNGCEMSQSTVVKTRLRLPTIE